MSKEICVEVVFATPDQQILTSVSLPAGATVADAISAANLEKQFPDSDLDALATGIWGKPVDRAAKITDGDRVELYRDLLIDPRDARRQLALAGRTMREGGD